MQFQNKILNKIKRKCILLDHFLYIFYLHLLCSFRTFLMPFKGHFKFQKDTLKNTHIQFNFIINIFSLIWLDFFFFFFEFRKIKNDCLCETAILKIISIIMSKLSYYEDKVLSKINSVNIVNELLKRSICLRS